MKLSKHEELVALGSALYLLGIEMEASRERLKELVDKGHGFDTTEIAEEYKKFINLSKNFEQIEVKYLRLRGDWHR